MCRTALTLVLWSIVHATLQAQPPAASLNSIDALVYEAIHRKELPGAVVLVLHKGDVTFERAYGNRALVPNVEPMTIDTVFDLASLTKPIATATCVLQLIEEGKLRLEDHVATHLPGFGANGKDAITVEHLLLHVGGLIADNPLADYERGPEEAWQRIERLQLVAKPGEKFTYTDVGFIVLGKLVEKLRGAPLNVVARQRIFQPLGMERTNFGSNAANVAPTHLRDGRWLRGEVHDPRAAKLGGVAGHAGLFGPASDLARFAQMLLDGGGPVLRPEAVRLMTTRRPVPGGLRALGWDVKTSYSANRGEVFGDDSFGHTGFTGTSLWIDPPSQTAVIFLSNRVHPDGKGNVTKLRGKVATLVAQAVAQTPSKAADGSGRHEPKVLNGIDVLEREEFKRLQGKRVGLVTNHTGLNHRGETTIDLLHKAPGVHLTALFSPEHGIRGQFDAKVADGKDEKTGLPVYSLYGERRRPTPEQLQGLDVIVYDIQDIGCRFYTYVTTLGYVLEEAAKQKIAVVVLDRPNPIGGLAVAGPVLDAGKESFTAYHRLPVRHGMTVGELARLFNAERKLGCDLHVVALQGWRRSFLFDSTGQTWINPSPNMRSLAAALLYPGIGLLEFTNLSVGRGTDRPFEQFGAPWLDGQRLAAHLSDAGLHGVRFVPTHFTPTSSTHAGKRCGGVQIYVDEWRTFDPLQLGMAVAAGLRKEHPDDWQRKRYETLLGHQATLEMVEKGARWQDMVASWDADLEAFKAVRGKYLLYGE